MKGKVSLITPCYNGEKFTQLYIDNIKRQDYPFVQVIFVNDGSIGDMEAMVREIKAAVQSKGYEFLYLSKENGGAASAVNLALQHVTGDYLMLLDMDDELLEGAISAKAEYLNAHPEYDTVISNGYYAFEDKRRRSCPFVKGKKVVADKIFEKLLQMSFYNWPGSYMVRSQSFFDINGGREIYQSLYGQNMQILLPATYKRRVYFMDQYLMKYYVRKQSVSHTEDKNRMLQLVNGYEAIRETVVKQICHKKQEQEYYLRLIKVASIRKKLHYVCRKKDKQELNRQYAELKALDAVGFLDMIVHICGQNIVFTWMYKVVNYIIERVTNKVV